MTHVALITGITGQDGSYLAELLLEKGYSVFGIKRRTSQTHATRIDHIKHRITLNYGDMQDGSSLNNYIHEIVGKNPTMERFEIYNLAAQSHVHVSFEVPEYTAETDAMGVIKLLEIILSLPRKTRDITRFYQAGTSEMFGEVLEVPQDEQTPFNPVSPYAAAKVYAHNVVKIYRRAYELYMVNGILFNHESPRRGANFVTKKIIDAIKDDRELVLGNLDSERDWGHAKDYVRAMWLMMQQNTPDDYAVGTGQAWTVREFVERSFKYDGVKITWKGKGVNERGYDQYGRVRVRIDPEFFRPCEVDRLLCKPTKIKSLGWKTEYNIDSLIKDMFEN